MKKLQLHEFIKNRLYCLVFGHYLSATVQCEYSSPDSLTLSILKYPAAGWYPKFNCIRCKKEFRGRIGATISLGTDGTYDCYIHEGSTFENIRGKIEITFHQKENQ